MMPNTLAQKLLANWFWPLAVLMFCFVWGVTQVSESGIPLGWENVVVFDAMVTLPILYWICYRKAQATKAMLLRIVAVQCLGIWLATKLVPVDQQQILPSLSWARYAGIAVLVVIEFKLMMAVFRLLFKPETGPADVERAGMPPLLAKLALMEVRFWRWVFSAFRK